ncbi:MAG: hypothetical protein HC849_07785 [Oscillatoriales cyanobacterium RU_3_3]|nr:hypothetical protein [Oscillatoriales cyanobacterium RU_3_3]NJR24488.1 hypothetical protein [Richelia sp. CSU_2_1]
MLRANRKNLHNFHKCRDFRSRNKAEATKTTVNVNCQLSTVNYYFI